MRSRIAFKPVSLRSQLKTAWRRWVWHVAPTIIHLISHRKNPVQATFSWPRQRPDLGSRVVLFIHFDRAHEVRPHVCDYLRALQAAGCSILFVSNSGSLKADAVERIKPCCAGILVRRDVGDDFAAMREGLSHFGLPHANTEMLIIAKDSVYGPLVPLDAMLAQVDFEKADFWGATDSWQNRYHLQSDVMIAGELVLHHPQWRQFWNQVLSVPRKRWAADHYEIRMTQWLLDAGLRCAALWKYENYVDDVDESLLGDSHPSDLDAGDPAAYGRRNHARHIRRCWCSNVPLNPTSDLWRQLLRQGFPFLKRELLRDNPTKVADIMDWRLVVAQTSNAGLSAIEQDLPIGSFANGASGFAPGKPGQSQGGGHADAAD